MAKKKAESIPDSKRVPQQRGLIAQSPPGFKPLSRTQFMDIPKEALDAFDAQAERWMSGKKESSVEMLRFLQKRIIRHMLISDWIVEHPPQGRSGPLLVQRHMVEFSKSADKLLHRFEKVLKLVDPKKEEA